MDAHVLESRVQRTTARHADEMQALVDEHHSQESALAEARQQLDQREYDLRQHFNARFDALTEAHGSELRALYDEYEASL